VSTQTEPHVVATNGRVRRDPTVPLLVEFGAPLAMLAAQPADEFRSLVAAELAVALERLGVRGEPVVAVMASTSRRPVRVCIHGRYQPYPPTLARRAWIAAVPPHLRGLATEESGLPEPAFPSGWLLKYTEDPDADLSVLFAFAARLVHAVALQRPSWLLGREQIVRHAERSGIPLADAAAILGPLLDLGVSVGHSALVKQVVDEGKAVGRPAEDTIEAAFTQLRSHVVELLVHPDSLRELLGTDVGEDSFSVYSSRVDGTLRELFRGLEQMFFEQFGFLLPRLDWVATRSMPRGMLSIRSDAWSTLPVPLVLRGERLALADADLGNNDHARAALHPITGARCLIVEGTKEALDAKGVTTWGPIDFVVLNVYAELAARAGRVLGMEEIEYQLARLRYQRAGPGLSDDEAADGLADGPYRELVYAVLAMYSIGDLTRVCRAFVEEGLSMRNLPEILEWLAHYETVPVSRDAAILFDDRIAEPAGPGAARDPAQAYYEFCRKNMKAHVSARHSWAENTVVAYLLEPSIERRASRLAAAVRAGGPRSQTWEDEAESFRDAVWAEVQFIGAAPRGQVVLVGAGARAGVLALLTPELPELPVVAFCELEPAVNVQPVARIGAA
jgi:FHIPEP family